MAMRALDMLSLNPIYSGSAGKLGIRGDPWPRGLGQRILGQASREIADMWRETPELVVHAMDKASMDVAFCIHYRHYSRFRSDHPRLPHEDRHGAHKKSSKDC